MSTIYLGIFPAAIAYVAWAMELSLGETGSVASMLYAEPVVAIIVAWQWLQEFPSLLSIIRGIVAITSAIIVNWIGIKRWEILQLIETICATESIWPYKIFCNLLNIHEKERRQILKQFRVVLDSGAFHCA